MQFILLIVLWLAQAGANGGREPHDGTSWPPTVTTTNPAVLHDGTPWPPTMR